MNISCFADEISPQWTDQLRVMKALGLRWMEIRSMWGVGVLELNAAQLRDVRSQANDHGIQISCIASPIGKADVQAPMNEAVEQLKRAAAAAYIAGCKYVRCFSFQGGTLPREEARALATDKLLGLTNVAREENVVLLLESGKTTVCATGAECAAVLKDIHSANLRAVMDPASFVSAGERPFEQSYPELEPYIEYVHIKDCKRGAADRTVAGSGDAQLGQILNALREREELFISLEPHLAYVGPVGGFSGEDGFKRAHQALLQMLETLAINAQ